MEYQFELTVPAGTAASAPVSAECRLSKGIIHSYAIEFLQGCNSLVNIAIFEGGFQCFPINPGGAFRGNAGSINNPTFYPLESAPYILTVKGWSPDCTYNHVIQIRFDVLPREYFDKSADTEAVIAAVGKELQREYSKTMLQVVGQLERITDQITPKPKPEPEPEPQGLEILNPPGSGLLENAPKLEVGVIRAQLKQGWKHNAIIQDSLIRGKLHEAQIIEIIRLLTTKEGGNNG